MKQCTGCGRLDSEPLGLSKNGEPYLACCPDSNYVEVKAMKLYTEEQVREMLSNMLVTTKQVESMFETLTPIELSSDDQAGVIALKIADTLKDKLTTTQEAYFIAGFQTYPKWMREQILNQNK